VIEGRYRFEECTGRTIPQGMRNYAESFSQRRTRIDGHEQTFGNADGGGCVVGMFGCVIIR
jgi:hypothetical protein